MPESIEVVRRKYSDQLHPDRIGEADQLCYHLDRLVGFCATLSGYIFVTGDSFRVERVRANDLMTCIKVVVECIDEILSRRPDSIEGVNRTFIAVWPVFSKNVDMAYGEVPADTIINSTMHLLMIASEALYRLAGCDPAKHVPLEEPWVEFGESLMPQISFRFQTIQAVGENLLVHLERNWNELRTGV